MDLVLYLAYVFVLYSFLGWVLEEVYCLVITKHFKEDGFLFGPFKPMYGFVIAILVYAVNVLRTSGFALLALFIVVPTLIEYISGYGLRKIFNKDYWNYSHIKFNYKGLVCMRFSVYWGILTAFVIFIVQPVVDYIFFRYMGVFDLITPIFILYIIADCLITIKLLRGFKGKIKKQASDI
ncbi:putative ABC transporter permease [Clostridium sp. LP20]|uniref:putative ABC transporter permease n=1 Tax=Clostridium sp. LP20 TaxID=3418665 RepID=UPI003EE4777B